MILYLLVQLKYTRWVSVERKSSVCLICMKYGIIILIIIIISLGKILLSYIANTSCTHTCTRVRTHAHVYARVQTHTAVAAVQIITIRWRQTVTARSAGDNAGCWLLKYTLALAARFPRGFAWFWRIKKILGRTET